MEEAVEALLWPGFRVWVKGAFSAEMHVVLEEWEGATLVGVCVADRHPLSVVATLQTLEGRDRRTLLDRMEERLRDAGALAGEAA